MADDDFFAVPDKKPSEQPAVAPPKNNGTTFNSTPSKVESSLPPKTPTESSKAFSLEEANEEIAQLLTSGKVSQKEVSSLQGMTRDHAAPQRKSKQAQVSLPGRSAKAQREAKMGTRGHNQKAGTCNA
jgi:hypothetical protein